jgi:tRNA threonylcarbamoyl adenosine modification protein (Sua5/YciO/YrdC/YwlC family)
VSQYFKVHPVDPQRRLLLRAVDIIRAGGIVVYPTDSSYAFGWNIGDKAALDKIRWIRQTQRDHDFTLVCRDLSDIATYAKVDNSEYRLLRAHTPGPYTFILRATHETPKRLQDPKRRSIGIRVPDHPIAQGLLEILGRAPHELDAADARRLRSPLTEPEEVVTRVGKLVDAIIDGGACGMEPTSIIDFTRGEIAILRRGKGDTAAFES